MANDSTRRSACPSREELEAFHKGLLSESQSSALADHLASCGVCGRVLESLELRDAEIISAVTAARRWTTMFDEPCFHNLASRGQDVTLPSEAGPTDDSEPGLSTAAHADAPEAVPSHAPRTRTFDGPSPVELVPASDHVGEPLPEKIGEFLVLRRIGAGGFGSVYLGRDSKQDSQVAIKIPKAGPAVTEEGIANFLREARLVAELQHPRIAHVRDFQRLPDHGCCIVMQYFEGGSLDALLKRERFSYRRAAEMIADLAEALHDAHKHRIYHRDIKPANILLDAEGRSHLTDFGLALLDEDCWVHRDELAGTRAYMSPEQVQRRTQFIDARTDIWSLGVIFYEMLTRERPFRGRTPEQLTAEILHKRPNPRLVDAEIPVPLERICTRCLERDPARRYTTALDLAVDLRHWLGRGTSAQTAVPPSPAASLSSAVDATILQSDVSEQPASVAAQAKPAADARRRRRRFLAGAAAAGGLVALGPAAYYALSRREPADPSWIALLDREPEMFSWAISDGREAPRFDARTQRYAVRSERSRWIARVRDIAPGPIALRAKVGIEGWQGFGGIMWALREDTVAKHFRFFSVEFFCAGPPDPPKLVVFEMSLVDNGYQDIGIGQRRFVATEEIVAPKGNQALLELSISPEELRVRFDERVEWAPEDLLGRVNWLPDGPTAVGLTGQGREIVIERFSLRYLL